MLTSLAPAHAATQVSSLSAPALGGLEAPITAALESSGEGAAEAVTPEARAAAIASAGGGGLQARTASSGGDATEQAQSAKFTPPDTPYNGSFTRELPIEVPPFFGIEPRLGLNYDSGDTAVRIRGGFGPYVVGWSLSGGSSIERTGPTGGVPLGSPLR